MAATASESPSSDLHRFIFIPQLLLVFFTVSGHMRVAFVTSRARLTVMTNFCNLFFLLYCSTLSQGRAPTLASCVSRPVLLS